MMCVARLLKENSAVAARHARRWRRLLKRNEQRPLAPATCCGGMAIGWLGSERGPAAFCAPADGAAVCVRRHGAVGR